MPTKRQTQYYFETHHFVILFWLGTALLYGMKKVVQHFALPEEDEVTAIAEAPPTAKKTPAPKIKKITATQKKAEKAEGRNKDMPDSIADVMKIVDQILLRPRQPVTFLDANGKAIRNNVREIDCMTVFNDLNDVQLATAALIGAPECKTRKDVTHNGSRYVYIGASPYFDMEPLTYSVPYLVPRAAILLDEIGHAFLDSLTAKGIPFHKFTVTSVLRTEEDVAKLTRSNSNATEQSCHRFGTTFDIAYSTFYRVYDPAGEKKNEWPAKELKEILSEVLEDQHNRGTCYIKYETRRHCFHITCR